MSLIETIEIKNYKSIRHQKIEGCKRVSVFIGYPNVGKSNILEALSLFSINENDLGFNSIIRIERLTTLFYNGSIERNLEVRINGNKRWVGKMFDNYIRFEKQYANGDGIFGESLAVMHEESQNPGEFTVGGYFELFEGGNIQSFRFSSEKEIRFNQLSCELKKYVFRKDISYTLGKYHSLSHPHGANLFSILSTRSAIKKLIDELFEPYGLQLLYDSRDQNFTILKKTESGIFTIPYHLVADTLQRLIFYRTAVLSNEETILLFEEPEAHMFPPYISRFTSDMVHDENNNQFFLTTHSPFVLNDLMENLKSDELAIYIVGYRKETGETQVYHMGEEEVHEAYQFGNDFFMNIDRFLVERQHG